MDFRSLHTFTTTDNVPVRVELAGPASRVLAFAMDFVAMLILLFCFFLMLVLLPGFRQVPEVRNTAAPLGIFVILFGYHFFLEWLWNGQTIGKRILGLRVVRQDGQAIGLWESLGRNLLRVVDVYLSGVGLICMLFNAQEKRFGDFLAGTLVIRNQPARRPEENVPLPFSSPDDSLAARRLSAEEAELLRSFLARRATLLNAERKVLAEELCAYFRARFAEPVHNELDLEDLLAGYQAK